ncbi:MAG: metallophosphoesterase family protein [Saprospiraceae bacterium]|nr:metallophosphoesterase family protein [Saprospiraceae bacterium]
MRIALISDTHGLIPDDVLPYLRKCDEVWHAGDIGDIGAMAQIPDERRRHWVWGNIDDHRIRQSTQEYDFFEIEGVRTLIIHIGGYPGRYQQKARLLIEDLNPDLFISGHSHILKIMRDHQNGLIHFNPGACGFKGFHKKRTFIRFDINTGKIENVEVIELSRHK